MPQTRAQKRARKEMHMDRADVCRQAGDWKRAYEEQRKTNDDLLKESNLQDDRIMLLEEERASLREQLAKAKIEIVDMTRRGKTKKEDMRNKTEIHYNEKAQWKLRLDEQKGINKAIIVEMEEQDEQISKLEKKLADALDATTIGQNYRDIICERDRLREENIRFYITNSEIDRQLHALKDENLVLTKFKAVAPKTSILKPWFNPTH